MQERRQGIILKSYMPHKQKIALLDKVWGRFDGIPNTERICQGALISFTATAMDSLSALRDIELLAIPLHVARVDILFFHHVLEICYLGIPLASREPAVFGLLLELYKETTPTSLPYKKAFLAKLFFLLGVYQQSGNTLRHRTLLQLLTESVDTVATRLIDLDTEKDVDAWLHKCIQEHPYRDRFKTVHFYTRVASYENI